MDDDYLKFVAILIVSLFISLGFKEYFQHKETIKAIESGYIQVIEDNKILWKKAEHD